MAIKTEGTARCMAEAAHNIRYAILAGEGIRSVKPAGLEEQLVPFAELSAQGKEREEHIALQSLRALLAGGYLVVSRGWVLLFALALGMDVMFLLLLLRILL